MVTKTKDLDRLLVISWLDTYVRFSWIIIYKRAVHSTSHNLQNVRMA